MCFLSSLAAATDCGISGSARKLYVAPASALQLQNAVTPSFTITNTGATRHQITGIDAALEFFEVPFSKDRDALVDVANSRAGARAFAHTVTVNVNTDEFDIQRQLIEGQPCCGYIVLAWMNSDRWMMLGIDYNPRTANYDAALMKLQHNFTSGATKTAEDAGSTIIFSAEAVTASWLPVSSAAAEGITVIAHVP